MPPTVGGYGGAQILGEAICDPHGVETGGRFAGLGLLPATTTLGTTKQVKRAKVRFRDELAPPGRALSGLEVEGYEIHFGSTEHRPPCEPAFSDGSGMVSGPVLGAYVHGLCEDPHFLRALAGAPPRRTLNDVFAGLADVAEQFLDMTAVRALRDRPRL